MSAAREWRQGQTFFVAPCAERSRPCLACKHGAGSCPHRERRAAAELAHVLSGGEGFDRVLVHSAAPEDWRELVPSLCVHEALCHAGAGADGRALLRVIDLPASERELQRARGARETTIVVRHDAHPRPARFAHWIARAGRDGLELCCPFTLTQHVCLPLPPPAAPPRVCSAALRALARTLACE